MRDATPTHRLPHLRRHLSLCLIIFAAALVACTRLTVAPLEERIITPGSLAVVGQLQKDQEAEASATPMPSPSPSATPAMAPPAPQKAAQPTPSAEPATTAAPKTTVAPTPTPTPTPKPTGSLHGAVQILDESGQALDAQGMLLRLSAADGKPLPHQSINMTHTVDMQGKAYLPRYLTINKNDRVSFVNRDKIKHNVFSSTGKNAFDLGTFAGGLKREVALNSEGIVKVYCNIHAEMASFIAVTDGDLATVADLKGNFTFDHLSPGDYVLNVWHVRGETTRAVTITPNKNERITITLRSETKADVDHKNKFGKSYTTNANFFEDEFY